MPILGGKSKDDAYLGIDIGSGGMKVVELHKTKGRPQLWTYGMLNESLDIHIGQQDDAQTPAADKEKPFVSEKKQKKKKNAPVVFDDPRVDQYADYLKALLKESKTTTTHATASLPVSYVFHTVLTLPEMEEKEMESVIQAQVAKVVSKPIEQMQIVHQPVPISKEEKEKQKYQKVLVTAAPKSLIQFYTAIFQKAGLQLEELETEAFALERSLVGKDTATSMIVDIGSERTNFFIIDQGLPMTHRSISMGGKDVSAILAQRLGVDPQDVEQIKRDMSQLGAGDIPVDAFHNLIDPIIQEIRYGFDLYLHQTGNEGKRSEKIILTGGTSHFPPIAKQLSNAFDMRVFVGDPWGRVVYQQGLKPVLDDIGPRMAVSIGLAMRNIV